MIYCIYYVEKFSATFNHFRRCIHQVSDFKHASQHHMGL